MSRLKERIQQYEEENDRRWIRIHLTGVQAFLCVVVFFLSMTCVFVAGLLTGRGVSKESRESLTVTGTFYRLLGLRSSSEEPVDNASETWIPAEKILASLESERELATGQKPTSGPASPTVAASSARLRRVPDPQAPANTAGEAEQPALSSVPQEEASETPPPAPTSSEAYAIMVASMRRQENAVALTERLKKKGYKATMEKIAVNDQDVWYRVILGGFESRQKALEHAARLNKEEQLQAIVIRRESSGSTEN
ncbi:MAG: SPOR domain-containing protein [Desulfosoma sp.]